MSEARLSDPFHWVTIFLVVSAVVFLGRFVFWCIREWHWSRWRHLEDRSLGE